MLYKHNKGGDEHPAACSEETNKGNGGAHSGLVAFSIERGALEELVPTEGVVVVLQHLLVAEEAPASAIALISAGTSSG